MDSISNMIIAIKNGNSAGKEAVSLTYSKVRFAIAECLVKEGYISSVSKKAKKGLPTIEIALSYENKKPKVVEAVRISKPSRRIYYGAKDIRPVKNGHGIMVLSTPKGIMSGKDARKEMVGGEALFKIW